ncbi:unnamed protein product, partial [Rodentolepis nana]|uniref:EB1 C-terminal domain-containing protein n=1 Tax=Rodentolepis nana TaxID=102285 RepID=A0A0R3TXK3_RODNA
KWLDDTQQVLEEKKEIKRKCDLLLKIYEEQRIEKLRYEMTKYKMAARAALYEWIDYSVEPRPDPAALLRSAGFEPEILDLEDAD